MSWNGFTSTGSFGSSTYFTTSYALANPENPMLAGNARDVEFSTNTEMAIVPGVIFDSNSYYRLLGFSWPYTGITKKDLFEHYRDLDGANDAPMTNAFKQLINPVVRRHYDRLRFGELYVDQYVLAWMKREAMRKAHEATRVMQERGFDGDYEGQVDAFMRQMGFTSASDETAEESNGDTPSSDVDTKPAVPEYAYSPRAFWFGFYQWRTRCADLERLAIWQDVLIAAFRDRKVVAKLAVGFHGRMAQSWLLGSVGNRLVVYLRDDEPPTSALAQAVVDRVVSIQNQDLAKREITS